MANPEYDAIITLGGNLDSQGQLAHRNFSRLDTAIDLFHQGVADRLIMTGGWPLFTAGPEHSEAELMRDYAVQRQVPESAIMLEDSSRETIGNAVATKVKVLEPNKLQKVLLVTSESHVRRCKRIFEHVLGPAFEIGAVSAPERHAGLKRAGTIWGRLTLAYILDGIQKGDDVTVRHRLVENVPGYGSNVSILNFRAKSLAKFVAHPLSFK